MLKESNSIPELDQSLDELMGAQFGDVAEKYCSVGAWSQSAAFWIHFLKSTLQKVLEKVFTVLKQVFSGYYGGYGLQ